MKPEDQRIAIAEFCGWTQNLRDAPDYLHDLNAMHEAEKLLGNGRHANYEKHLKKLCLKSELDWVSGKRQSVNTSERYSWHATASQRAEALLRTIGKWTE